MEGNGVHFNPDKRFAVNDISKERLKEFRGLNAELSEKNTWFVGNTMIGSMIMGSANEASDIDAHWFYDSSKITSDVVTANLSEKDLEYNTADKDQKRVAALNKLTKDVKAMAPQYFKDGKTEQYFQHLIQSPDYLIHDINPEVLSEIITRYGNQEYTDDQDFGFAMSGIDLYPIKYLFLANVNDNPGKINEYRRIVLDKLKNTKQGERIFQGLLDGIRESERLPEEGHIAYGHYPKTIDEAYTYFRLPQGK